MPPKVRILEDVAGSFLGVDTDTGRPVLLVATDGSNPPPNRAAGDVFLRFASRVEFDLGPNSFTASAAIVECSNQELGLTFDVLARDIAQGLQVREKYPAPQAVSQALGRWERLLRSSRRLSRMEVIGLWGELWLLLQLPQLEAGVLAWRGPSEGTVDFVGGGIGIECKTSLKRLEHFVSQGQLARPLGDLCVYLLSLWVDEDTTGGETLEEMVAKIDQGLSSRLAFEMKLLEAGYSRVDAAHYALRLRRLEPPVMIPINSVPRVREADPGVSHIRFTVALPESCAISPSEMMGALARICLVDDDEA